MKNVAIIVRILIGLMFVMAFTMITFNLAPQPKLTGNAQLFMTGMMAAKYFMPLLMWTEFVCGLAFLIGRFVPLATVVIFPVTLNILLYHIFVDPAGLGVAVPLILGNLFLAYYYRKHYVSLVAAK